MKLIVWLWNPTDEYKITRHNLWFMFLDWLIKRPVSNQKETGLWNNFNYESKFKWDISTLVIDWEKVILLKPMTYMNLSWESIINLVNFYKISKEDLIVIYDDISMEFWKIRFRDKWSAGGHNWIKNIIKYLKEDFKRIKVWIWYDSKYDVSSWVLSKFSEEELIDLEQEVFPKVYDLLIEKL